MVSRTEGRPNESYSKFGRPSKLADKVNRFKASAKHVYFMSLHLV